MTKKNYIHIALQILCFWVVFYAPLSSEAQWLTETVELETGWNAVFMHVDPSHATIESKVGRDINNPITRIWRWNPPSSAQFYSHYQDAAYDLSGWSEWQRNDQNSALTRLVGNTAYLVYSYSNYTWRITGKPVVPRHFWSIDGANLIGFPTTPNSEPTFDQFIREASELTSGNITVLQYAGSSLSTNNPSRVESTRFRATPVSRGKAFWLWANDDLFNKYFGAFEVDLAGAGGINYRDSLSTASFRLRNLTQNDLTVTVELIPSETAPSGQEAISGTPPLLVRGAHSTNGFSYGYTELSVGAAHAHQWTLAGRDLEGSEVNVVLGLDRSSINQPAGSLLAGILRVTDSLGHLEINVPVSARVKSQEGLWVGEALVTEVGQYLKTYESGATKPILVTNGTMVVTNDLIIASNGNYVVSGIDTSMTEVPRAFPLRLIVHQSTNGSHLCQQVFIGSDSYSNRVICLQESVLDPARLEEARRITATHLPWTTDNSGWAFDQSLLGGNVASVDVAVPYDDQRSNPFLHTYHPDHDNLNASFSAQLPQGSESYALNRNIRLQVSPMGTNFTDRVSVGNRVYGHYEETIEVIGLRREGGLYDTRSFEVRGAFMLERLSDIPVLTTP